MVQLRKTNDVFVYGKYQLLGALHPDIYAFRRALDEKKVLALLNFSAEDARMELEEVSTISEPLINNLDTLDIMGNKITLKPYQAILFSLK